MIISKTYAKQKDIRKKNWQADVTLRDRRFRNEQLVIKNRRARRIWKTVGIVLLVLFIWQVEVVNGF